MSGISLGTGLFSGIDSGSIIQQLLAIEARPRALAQQRIVQLQFQQSAVLEINTRMKALQDAASAFRKEDIFDLNSALSSKEEILTATAGTSAVPGSYKVLVDRLVSTHQMLSQKGFVDRDTTGINAGTFSFEDARARLDRDVNLSELNNGQGISRGKIIISDGTNSETIDLSKAVTVNDVIDKINSAGLDITASADGTSFKLEHGSGGSITVSNAAGYTTANSLGIAGTATGSLSGTAVYGVHTDLALSALNDGNGVYSKDVKDGHDFAIEIAGEPAVKISLGTLYDSEGEITSGPVKTIGALIQRINDTMAEADLSDVEAQINAAGTGIEIVDSGGRDITITENDLTSGNTAADLGILTNGAVTGGTVTGTRLLAGLNSTLTSNLIGGGDLGDGSIDFTLRNGSTFNVALDLDGSVTDIINAIETASAGDVSVALNDLGTGLIITDHTGGGGNLIITGTGGNDTAAALGISTGPTGVAADTVTAKNLNHTWITAGTKLADLNQGRGIGTGSFRIIDSTGASAEVKVTDDTKTIGDLINVINTRGLEVKARMNAQGDGIELYEDNIASGGGTITVEEIDGAIAKKLNLLGEADVAGGLGTINGSFQVDVEFDPTDTLDDVISKINDANVGITASVINDGSSTSPFKLSFSSKATGQTGRFILDTGSFNLNLQTMDKGDNAVAFIGSDDPAKAVLVTSTTNQLENSIPGVTIDLKQTSSDPVTVTVSQNREEMITKVNEFITAFNDVLERMDELMDYDEETERRGALLGDSTMLQLRAEMTSLFQRSIDSVSGTFDSFLDVGMKIGEGGKAVLDEARLQAAMDEDMESVRALFSDYTFSLDNTEEILPGVFVSNPDAGKNFSSIGLAGLFEEMTVKYIDSIDGILTNKNKGYDTQIETQNSRIDSMNARLEIRRGILEAQFQAMESAIARLQGQQGALAQLGSLG
ncbi:MAG: flagellar filament capping protein FliD [Phycisphaeraceae bacterium]|nr:flagellar filament capping protein FliD [Phycisphaerales bacterium]MCB9861016.1 flagellar filament capping protein FliD [Phycisphaeraceae bacterium]